MERRQEGKGGEARSREENHVCSHHLIRMNKSHSDSGDISEMVWKVDQNKNKQTKNLRGESRETLVWGVMGLAGSCLTRFRVLRRALQAASKR